MPPEGQHGVQHDDDRRGVHRRLEMLESHYQHLQQAVQRIEIQVSSWREVIDSRYQALNRGQDLMLSKIEMLDKRLDESTSFADKTPVGRDTSNRLRVLEDGLEKLTELMTELVHSRDTMYGGLLVFKWMAGIACGGTLIELIHFLAKVGAKP